jgi:hypothetical protein
MSANQNKNSARHQAPIIIPAKSVVVKKTRHNFAADYQAEPQPERRLERLFSSERRPQKIKR